MHLPSSLIRGDRYYVPTSVREHIDYIMPGVVLREVTGKREYTQRLSKRSMKGQPPILEPIPLPFEELLSGVTSYCSLAITPQCIQGRLSDGISAPEEEIY